jgi:hypothetical protein
MTVYSQGSAIKVKSNLCQKISESHGSEELYIEYIDRLLLCDIKNIECIVEDPFVFLLNDFLKLKNGHLTISEFAKEQVAGKKDVQLLWAIDSMIVSEKSTYKKWIDQYGCSFANCVLNEIGSAEALKDNYTFQYFLQLLKNSDGEYAENVSSRLISLFYDHPEFIMSNISKFVKVSEKIVSLFCFVLPDKEQNKLKHIYMRYPSDNAKIVLNWLSCGQN